MAMIGLGNDLVEIARIEKILASDQAERFVKRVLTETELALFTQHKQAARYLAKRWAAKEAAAKALGTGIAGGVSFQDFEIVNNEQGQPLLTLTGMALRIASQRHIRQAWLSLTDEQHYALATVVLES